MSYLSSVLKRTISEWNLPFRLTVDCWVLLYLFLTKAGLEQNVVEDYRAFTEKLIFPGKLYSPEGVVVINTGGHLSTASTSSAVLATATGTPTGLIIPHTPVIGNSLQQQPPGAISVSTTGNNTGGSNSPSPTG